MSKYGSNQTRVPKQVQDHMVTGARFDLVWDPKIRAYYTHPIPTDLAPYYDHPEYISHNDQASGLLAGVYRIIRKFNIRLKLHWVKTAKPPGKHLLDYGSGIGDFLSAARQRSWNAKGIEVSGLARTTAENKGLRIYKNQEEASNATYDVITLWHVLEHLSDPIEMCGWFIKHLSSRGLLFVAVPNHCSWDAKFYQEFWAAYDVPRHLWHFSRESIATIFNDDFEIIQTHPMWFDSIYVSLLSERYKKNQGSVLRGIFVGIWSNLIALFSREPSSVVYVLKKRK